MREIQIFYLTGCPYCDSARQAAAELMAETPAYRALRRPWPTAMTIIGCPPSSMEGTSSMSARRCTAMAPSRPI